MSGSSRLLRRVGVAALAVTFGLAPALVGGVAQAAAPAGFDVSVTPTTGLADGDTVEVTLGELTPGEGVYVMYCVQPAPGERATGAACGGNTWAGGDGPTDATAPIDIVVTSSINGVDCTEVSCGIQVRGDHTLGNGPSADRSYDRFIPLSFGDDEENPGGDEGDGGDTGNEDDNDSGTDEPAGFSVDVDPTEGLQDGDVVDVTLNGLPSDVGVYVQFCVQQPNGARAAGDQCDGTGTWALGDNPYGSGVDGPVDGPILDPAAGPIPTTVSTSIGSVDCTEVVCGVQTRRDHRGGGDTTYDSFTPVSFAADAVVDIQDDAADTDADAETDTDADAAGAGDEAAESGPELAATGSSTTTLATFAALLLAVGGVALASTRRFARR